MFTLTSMLMFLCIPTSAQEIVVGHIDDADSIFFNSAHYDGLGITSLDDIIDKLPGAERQDDGSITVNGKHITRILINGKQWFPEHEYVDLGLSVKWATCNVGASKPDENGEYFAWGETNSKEEYDWPSYKHCAGRSWDSMIKYNCDKKYGQDGYTDDKTILESQDDAASVNWGGSWRMPTMEELQELIDNCNWTWTTQNGKAGYMATSKKPGFEGHSIFLPAAGDHMGSVPRSAGKMGAYLSSSLDTDCPEYANYLFLTEEHVIGQKVQRFIGSSVRPICP